MASDFNSIARAIRYLGDCVRYLADKYVAVNDRVYSDWNEASKVVGDVGRDHVADYAEASHKQGKSRTWRHSHLMEREDNCPCSRGVLMLTPNDVRHRKFRTYRSLLYGEVYDAEDVDDFLDLVADIIKVLGKEALKARKEGQ